MTYMSPKARKAFEKLQEINAPVYDRNDNVAGCNFILGAELRHRDDRYFADYYGEEIKEYIDDNDKIINACGIRQDVIDILDEFDLYVEWHDPGTCGIYPKFPTI